MVRSFISAVCCGLFAIFLLATPAHATSVTFTDLNAKTLLNVGHDSGIYQQNAFQITNNTGVAWTDFHMIVSFATAENPNLIQGDGSIYFGDVSGISNAYSGPGTAAFQNATSYIAGGPVDITGISIPTGGEFDFSIGTAHGEILGTFFLIGNPTTGGGGSAIPEPSTMMLLGSGLVGLIGYGRKRLKK